MPSPDPRKLNPRNKGMFARFIVACAGGLSIREAAKSLGVPVGTAKAWSLTQEYKRGVKRYRKRLVDQAIGELSMASVEASRKLRELCRNAETEGVQLAAARALLEKLPPLHEYHSLEKRFKVLEERLKAEQKAAQNGRGSRYGTG